MNHRTALMVRIRIITVVLCAFCIVLFKAGDSTAWFTTFQNADLVLNVPGFNNSGYLNNPNDGLLFNHPMNISTDNTRLLLADTRNNRILIWNSLPSGNVSPDIVLGQTSLTSNDPGTSLGQLNWPVGVSAAAGKVVVADTNNHRILIWNSFPTRNGQPADLYINNLPLPADPISKGFDGAWPWGLWTDGTKLVASATQAGKVLIWNTFPTANNQAPDLTLNGQRPDGSWGFGTPRSIGTDGRTFLVVSDHNASPTSMFWNSFPATNDQPYSFAMNNPEGSGVQMMEGGVLTSSGKFVIQTPPGISIWNGVPASAAQASNLFVGRPVASGVLQQEDERCTADGYAFDDGDGSHLAIASSGKVYISLYNGNKVVGYNALPTYKQQCPDFVIGSPDIATNTYSNKYIQNPIPATNGSSLVVGSDFDNTFSVWQTMPQADATPSDYTFRFTGFSPTSLAVSNNTWVAVGNSGEVRIWSGLPGPNDGNMTAVFTGGIGPVTFQNARGIALDGKYLFVSDNTAGKLYVWNALPNQNTAPLFTLSIPGADRLSSDGQYLAVVDSQNHRVNIYDAGTLSSSSSPVAQIPPAGASYNFSTGPGSVTVADGHLFVADPVYGRVLVWKSMTDVIAGHGPDAVLGQQDLNQGMNNAIGKNRLFIPMLLAYSGNKLWVGEFKFQSRLLEFNSGDAPVCNLAISPSSQTFTSSGGTGSVGVTASDSTCTWTATSSLSWATITSGASGSGSGTVTFSVSANTTGVTRTGTITVAGRTFTITQTAVSCTYTISPARKTFTSMASTGTVTVTASSSSCAWTASESLSWVSIASGSKGTGNGTVKYSVTVNTTKAARTGTMTIAGKIFTITQKK